MKKIFIIGLLSVSALSFCQENDIKLKGLYYFDKIPNTSDKPKLNKFSLDINDNKVTKSDKQNIEIRHKQIIRVIKVDKSEVTFKYIKFKDSTTNKTYNGENDEYLYKMAIENFTYYTSTFYNKWRKWKVGAYTIPIRIRSKNENFEFESNLSVGANLIKGYNLNRYHGWRYIDGSIGIGLTKVNLTESNSSIEKVSDSLKTLSQSALTLSFGLTANLAKNVNVGVFYGWDFLNGREQEKLKWIHNKKPWIGFGINISFNDGISNNVGNKKDQN